MAICLNFSISSLILCYRILRFVSRYIVGVYEFSYVGNDDDCEGGQSY